MGTNYYVKLPERNLCTHCGRSDGIEEIHIGKSSGGWRFLFHPKFNLAAEWREFLKQYADMIYDEYGQSVEYDEFWNWVEDTKGKHYEPGERLDPEGYRICQSYDFC